MAPVGMGELGDPKVMGSGVLPQLAVLTAPLTPSFKIHFHHPQLGGQNHIPINSQGGKEKTLNSNRLGADFESDDFSEVKSFQDPNFSRYHFKD